MNARMPEDCAISLRMRGCCPASRSLTALLLCMLCSQWLSCLGPSLSVKGNSTRLSMQRFTEQLGRNSCQCAWNKALSFLSCRHRQIFGAERSVRAIHVAVAVLCKSRRPGQVGSAPEVEEAIPSHRHLTAESRHGA